MEDIIYLKNQLEKKLEQEQEMLDVMLKGIVKVEQIDGRYFAYSYVFATKSFDTPREALQNYIATIRGTIE